MRIRYFIIISILFYINPKELHGSEQDFNKASQLMKEKRYPEAVVEIKKACPCFKTKVYDVFIWKCNFSLAYAYQNLATITINGERAGYLKIHKNIVDSAIYYYENALRISKLDKRKVQLSDAILLSEIKIALGEFEYADSILDDLEFRMTQTGYPLWEQTDKSYNFIKKIILQLRDAIKNGERIQILVGNIGPFGFSTIQIQPSILFISNSNSSISTIKIGYSDITGNQLDRLGIQLNNDFNFNKPILLERKGIFPFDKYVTNLHIEGAELEESELPLSLFEPTLLQGKAYLKKNNIKLEIRRHPVSIVLFYIFFIISLVGTISLIRAIKNMKLKSFKWRNFESKFKLIATIVSFIFSLISLYDISSIWNAYTILLIGLFFYTLLRLLKRYYFLTRN